MKIDKWKMYQSVYCVDKFILIYVIGTEEMPYQDFVDILASRLRYNFPREMVEANVAHIAYIANFLQIKHHCDIPPLPDFPLHTLISFYDQLNHYFIFPNRKLLKELVKERYG